MTSIIVNRLSWPTEKHWQELKKERNEANELLKPKKKPNKPKNVAFNDENYEDAMKRIVNQFKGQL